MDEGKSDGCSYELMDEARTQDLSPKRYSEALSLREAGWWTGAVGEGIIVMPGGLRKAPR